MVKILGISGSLRARSFNSALLAAAVKLQPEGAQIEVASIRGIPLYDSDVEAQGMPAAVDALKARVVATDALLLVTPDYNNSLPGVFKNAIDWLSRPPTDARRVFGNRPVAIIGTSTGPYGTILSQQAWLPVLRALGTRPWFGGRLQVGHAQQVFDDQGELVDEKVRAQLAEFLRGFSAFAAGSAR